MFLEWMNYSYLTLLPPCEIIVHISIVLDSFQDNLVSRINY